MKLDMYYQIMISFLEEWFDNSQKETTYGEDKHNENSNC